MKPMNFLLTSSKWSYLIALLGIVSVMPFVSCEKTDDVKGNENTELTVDAALDQSFAADLFDEVTEIGDEAFGNFDASAVTKAGSEHDSMHNGGHMRDTVHMHGRNGMRLSDCVTITKVWNSDSVVTTIDFGAENCLSPDGKERRGKIIIIKKGGLYWTGSVEIVYTFEDYFVNDNQLTGTKTASGFINDEGNRQFDMVVNGEIILADNGGTISWTAERTREVVEGSDTWTKFDDKIEVTGFASGTTADGSIFSSEILEPLVRIHEMGCHRFYVSGIVKILKDVDTEITIDYGNGECDNLAEVTINGETKVVELKGHRRRF